MDNPNHFEIVINEWERVNEILLFVIKVNIKWRFNILFSTKKKYLM